MFDSFFSCSMVLTYSDLAGPCLRGSGSPRPTRYRCTGPAVRRRRGSYRLAENVRGGALMRPSPRALWTTPLRLGTAPGALSFLLTARLVDCLSRRMALRARVIRASHPALPVYEKRASAVLAGQ